MIIVKASFFIATGLLLTTYEMKQNSNIFLVFRQIETFVNHRVLRTQ